MVFFIRQRLAWADDNGIPGMDTHRVDIFHIADGNRGIVRIPDNLIFYFFIALDALFHQNLPHWGDIQRILAELGHFFRRIRKATTCSA